MQKQSMGTTTQRLSFRAQKQLPVYHSSLLFTLAEHLESSYELDDSGMFEGSLFLTLHAVQNHDKSIKRRQKTEAFSPKSKKLRQLQNVSLPGKDVLL